MANILALDQASHTTGYSIFKNGMLIEVSHFTCTGDLGERLEQLRKNIINLIDKYNIDEVVFEDIQLQDVEGSREVGIKTFKILAEVFGVVHELLTELKMPYEVVLPIKWKAHFKIAGKGRRQEKKASQSYALNQHNVKCTEDEADSLCIGLYYIDMKSPVQNPMEDWDWS